MLRVMNSRDESTSNIQARRVGAAAPSPRRRLVLAWLPAFLYMTAIWVLSSLSVIETPFDLGQFPHYDKLVHFFEYSGLAFVIAHAAMRTWPEHPRIRVAALAVLFTTMFGVSDEIHQSFVPGRHSDVLDLVADLTGSVFGTSARHALSWIRISIWGRAQPETLDSSELERSSELDRIESAERSSDGWA